MKTRKQKSCRRIGDGNGYRIFIEKINLNNTRVCGHHFVSGSPSALYDCTNPDWAPTQNMGHDNIAPESVGNAMSKYKRAKEREANKKQAASKKRKTSCSATSSTAAASEVFSPSVSFVDARGNTSAEAEAIEIEDVDVDPQTKGCQTDNCLVVDRSCQTDMTLADFDPQHGYIQSITTELHDWKKTALQLQISQNGFKDNDQKTKFYSGLPSYLMLIHVFNLLTPKISTTPMNALCQFQEFLLVLMRLKLNLPFQDLAYRFGVSASTATRIFYRWIPIMSERLDFLIKWPDRENLRKTMPLVFKQNFGNKVAVIIDCFEVFIDRPSSLIARAMTWSNYKHHNTVKFLIGITPQGVISFISKAWGGRVSDKYLTENSGILKNLLPGDIVLADRGFDIADSVGFHGARLYIPAFTKGKKQLSALEVEQTRKLANVRIHVERVIGLVRRKFTILQSTLPIESITAKQGEPLAPIDHIATVCCALTNLSDSIVS